MKSPLWKHPSWWPWRILQRLTGVHRIHHIRYSFGWRLPFVGVAYFPRWCPRSEPSLTYAYGWRRVAKKDYHDCTATGRY